MAGSQLFGFDDVKGLVRVHPLVYGELASMAEGSPANTAFVRLCSDVTIHVFS